MTSSNDDEHYKGGDYSRSAGVLMPRSGKEPSPPNLQSFETGLLTQADNRYRGLPPLTADIGGWYSVGFRRSTN
jgi:hypothetical protein